MSINIHFDTASTSKEELTGLAALLGHVSPVALTMAELRKQQASMYGSNAIGYGDKPGHSGAVASDPQIAETGETAVTLTNTERAGESEAQHAARRERGQPSGGRARRTKAEIAEDEAADKADATSGTTQSISTGEERVNPEDDADTQAQDRADEEAEEGKDAAPLTVMDGKAAIGIYLGKHGMEAAQADGMAIFTGALGNPPEGKAWGWTMLSELGDQSKIDKAVLAWQAAAVAKTRYGAK